MWWSSLKYIVVSFIYLKYKYHKNLHHLMLNNTFLVQIVHIAFTSQNILPPESFYLGSYCNILNLLCSWRITASYDLPFWSNNFNVSWKKAKVVKLCFPKIKMYCYLKSRVEHSFWSSRIQKDISSWSCNVEKRDLFLVC